MFSCNIFASSSSGGSSVWLNVLLGDPGRCFVCNPSTDSWPIQDPNTRRFMNTERVNSGWKWAGPHDVIDQKSLCRFCSEEKKSAENLSLEVTNTEAADCLFGFRMSDWIHESFICFIIYTVKHKHDWSNQTSVHLNKSKWTHQDRFSPLSAPIFSLSVSCLYFLHHLLASLKTKFNKPTFAPELLTFT